MSKIIIDPVTRIEGHIKIETKVENGVVVEAKSSGTLFRGFEIILQGRDPRDAPQLVQRICGVCPQVHATASVLGLDDAFGLADRIPKNGRLIRNLLLGSEFIHSHLLHFYHLAALDYVDPAAAAEYEGSDPDLRSLRGFIERGKLEPFLPRYEGDYRLSSQVNRELVAHYAKALEMRRKAHEMLAIFGGKVPHSCSAVPGGVTQVPTIDKMTSFLWHLNEIRDFIDEAYIPDVITVAEGYGDYFEIGAGCGNLLSYGLFDLGDKKRLLQGGIASRDMTQGGFDAGKIAEEVGRSWYASSSGARHPSQGETIPQPGKEGAYSWLKAPRYDGQVYEVGPLARVMVNYLAGNEAVKGLVDSLLSYFKASPQALFSVLGRHAARALECKYIADSMANWVLELEPGGPVFVEYEIPEEARGAGLTDAPRGALGHWVTIKDKKIANYQCVVPTTWNASPRDGKGQPGPMEQALTGLKVADEENPLEVMRVVHSFDLCLACAVH